MKKKLEYRKTCASQVYPTKFCNNNNSYLHIILFMQSIFLSYWTLGVETLSLTNYRIYIVYHLPLDDLNY